MLNVTDFRLHVIRPTLHHLGLWKPKAEDLVLGTALVESHLHALDQGSDGVLGPAYGLYQMEVRTHDDIWRNFLAYRPHHQTKVYELIAAWPETVVQLVTNMAYATAMCRIHYLRVRAPIPNSPERQAHYWKAHYNTFKGKGDPADYIRAWELVGLDRA
jgi:hypothetical protein